MKTDEQLKEEIINKFNNFIQKWCGSSYPHLIDTDENDGEEFRDDLRSIISKGYISKEEHEKILKETNAIAREWNRTYHEEHRERLKLINESLQKSKELEETKKEIKRIKDIITNNFGRVFIDNLEQNFKDYFLAQENLLILKSEVIKKIDELSSCQTGYPHVCHKNPENCEKILYVEDLKKSIGELK